MPSITRGNRSIHFTQQGEGPGVVLIPGLGSGARLFGTLPRRFAREGFTCCAVDPVGLEPSSPLPGGIYDFAQAAADVLAVAATLPQPVALIGTSLGGKVALQAATSNSEHANKLVMLCSAGTKTPRRGKTSGPGIGQTGLDQTIRHTLFQIIGGARLHAGRDFFGKEFNQQVGHLGSSSGPSVSKSGRISGYRGHTGKGKSAPALSFRH